MINMNSLSVDPPRLSMMRIVLSKVFRGLCRSQNILKIRSYTDCVELLRQLDVVANLCSLNRMAILWLAINICGNKEQIIFNYELRKTIIERANHVKDLAIILDSQLPYRQHIAYVVDKASRSLAVVFRMAKTSSDVYCFKSLYCCFARPT